MLNTYSEITNNILVSATPYLIVEKSRPREGQYFYAYHIRIKNLGEDTVQLQRRFWRIRHGGNIKEEIISGEGVVGQTPDILPGDEFEYQSFCPIPSAHGNMRGHYQFQNKHTGEVFVAQIPLVFLRPDHAYTPDPTPEDQPTV